MRRGAAPLVHILASGGPKDVSEPRVELAVEGDAARRQENDVEELRGHVHPVWSASFLFTTPSGVCSPSGGWGRWSCGGRFSVSSISRGQA